MHEHLVRAQAVEVLRAGGAGFAYLHGSRAGDNGRREFTEELRRGR